jgi:hypothetical protein
VSVGAQATRSAEAEAVPHSTLRARVGVEPMAGLWLKTNDGPQWIDSVEIAVDGDDLLVHVWGGRSGPSPADWGTARSEIVYASAMTTGDARAGAFVTHFAFESMFVELQANLNLGLLVVATFVSFREPTPFADRFTREFFHRATETESAT